MGNMYATIPTFPYMDDQKGWIIEQTWYHMALLYHINGLGLIIFRLRLQAHRPAWRLSARPNVAQWLGSSPEDECMG